MDAFFATFKIYERTIGVNLYSQLKQNAVHAKCAGIPIRLRARSMPTCPGGRLDMLIAQTEANLPTLYRYFRLRAKLLGVSQLHYYDITRRSCTATLKLPYDVGRKLVLEAVAPLGQDYVDAMTYDSITAGWIRTRARTSCPAHTWTAMPTTCTRTC